MTETVKQQLDLLRDRGYRNIRIDSPLDSDFFACFSKDMDGEAALIRYAIDCEEPVFHGYDLFGFNRYCNAAIPQRGRFGNAVIDYPMILKKGLQGVLDEIEVLRPQADEEAIVFYDAVGEIYDACFHIIKKYRLAAEEAGNERLAKALEQVPRRGARDYYEALITVRFLAFVLRIANHVHLPMGRFDQYMKPYYDISVAAGATEGELLELTELFFIALNFDTDLYIGMQKGDNGQSMVLGGCDRAGNDAFNDLSELCLHACEELELIDPKINLRVNPRTPLSLYERGTKLTKQGLGFPQYSNDDVVIDALTSLGYDLEDARDYAVAACWEFIVQYNSADVPNIHYMNFPLVIDRATRESLPNCATFDEFLAKVRQHILDECGHLMEVCNRNTFGGLFFPLMSSLITPCIARGRDLSRGGAKYNNFGLHGAGISTAADSLQAIRTGIFERGDMTPNELIAALDADFNGYEDLRAKLLSYPKMGNNDDAPDSLAGFLMDTYSEGLNGKPNCRGGVFRAGTGSAMGYILYAAKVGATADGRHATAPYASSFSPSPNAKLNGPLSAILSFTKTDLRKICNGGPFTIEIHDTVFRNDEGERKVAQLIKSYIDLGGHQIQINAINRDRLLDAQAYPEKYPNLIVRVWGWSGYFNELDTNYQNHIISRTEFMA